MAASSGLRRACGIAGVAFAVLVTPAYAQNLAPMRQSDIVVAEAPEEANGELPRVRIERHPSITVWRAPVDKISLVKGMATAIAFEGVFKSIHIGDPSIVDFVPESDHRALLVPKAPGSTNIEVLDDKLELMESLEIQVDAFPAAYGHVVVHNKALLNSQTNFRCASDDCVYTGEITVQEPAPLPTGHTQQSISQSGPVPNAGNPKSP